MRRFLFLTIAVAFLLAGCGSDDDDAADPASSTTQAEDQTPDTSDTDAAASSTTEAEDQTSDTADGVGESTAQEAPDGMIEACNVANIYIDPGEVAEKDISSEEERIAIEQVGALSQPITTFEVVEESTDGSDSAYLGYGQSDGWAWYCIYSPDTEVVRFDAFQAPTAINGVEGAEDGRWESLDLG